MLDTWNSSIQQIFSVSGTMLDSGGTEGKKTAQVIALKAFAECQDVRILTC